MDIEKMLCEEILYELADLKNVSAGSEEYKVSVDGVTKLIDKAIEFKKLEIDEKSKIDDIGIRSKQMDEDRIDRLVKNGIAIAGIIIPSVITVWGTVKSLKFEQDGTVTTIMGRGFINKLLPKK